MAAGDSVSISIEVYSSKELERSHCQSTELSTSAYQQPVEATDQGEEKANLVPGNVNVQVKSTSGSGTHNYGATASENSPPTEKLCSKRFKRLMIVLIFLLVIALLWLIVHNTYLWGIELKPLQYQLNVTMGDDSEDKDFTLLQELNSTISSATITLINPDITLTADMYLSPNRPPNYSTIFYKNIPILNGKNRYNYNVFGGDEPIYLTDGSSLMYNVSIEQVSSTVCPVRLYLFDNFTDYDRFRNPTADPLISYIDRSTCLYPKNGTWSFNISQSSTYYVGIDIDTGTSATSNVTVNRVNYNTSGLQRSTQLTSSNPTDTITTCESGNRFLCTRNDDQYLIVSINGKNTISFQLKTFQVYGVGRVVSFSLMLSVSVVLIVIIVIILIIVLVITVRMCHR